MSTHSSIHDSSCDYTEGDPNLRSDREIKCPVHGYISVSKLITDIIDTPQFQRLRNLKQLGTSYFVWPGASHNRFEHSLGVFHLSRLMVTRLRVAQPSLNITDRDVKCVQVAGLCHDLGHGPFSHVWDNQFIPKALPSETWVHEDMSEQMLDYLVEENNIDLMPDEVRFVKDLIAGTKKHTLKHDPPEKDYLFEIVANKRNGIDVDKFDYIARDTHAVSSGSVTDLLRLINSARVIDGQICYSEKNQATVFSLFQERFHLHKTIYNHKTAKSIEFMVVEALLKADPYLKIADRIHDPRRFMHLNDSILLEVERSECPELEESRQIIRRIRKRDLYKLVDKSFIPWDLRDIWREHFTPELIVEAAKNLNGPDFSQPEVKRLIAELTQEHVIVDMSALHHGMGDKFPLDNCKFYWKYSPNEARSPNRETDISHLLPRGFGEVWNRVFTRDIRFYGVVQAAARVVIARIQKLYPSPSSPFGGALRSSTPEVLRTPRATSSFSSILSDPTEYDSSRSVLKSPDPSTSTHPSATMSITGEAATTTTPFHSKFMTVSATFTPKGQRGSAKEKKRGKRKGMQILDEGEDEDDETDDPVRSGSPKRRRKAA